MYAQEVRGLNGATTCPVFTNGSTTTITSGQNMNYALKGQGYFLAAASNEATPTTDAVTGVAFNAVKGGGSVAGVNGNGCVFLLCRDSALALKVVQSALQPLDSSGAFVINPQFPELPDTLALLGSLTIKAGNTASTSGWIFGTHNTTGVTGITYTFRDHLLGVPSRPLA